MRRGEPDHLPPPPHATVAPPYRPLLAACPPGESAPGMLLERPARPIVQSLLAAGTARQSLPASHTCPSRPAHQSALVTWSIRPPDDDLLDGLRRLQTPPRSRSWLHWLEEVPNASGPKKNPPTEERVRNGAIPPKSMFLAPCSRWGPIGANSLKSVARNRVASPPPPRNPPSPRPPHLIIGTKKLSISN